MTQSTILLVDDHELFREGLAGLINTQPDMRVVGQASDGLEALTLTRDLTPHLVIMDINMPVCDGLEATRLIRAEQPETRIVILTIHDEDSKLFEAIKAGARGYILKDISSAEFLRGVRGALGGELTMPPKLASRLLNEFARLASQPVPPPQPQKKRPISPAASAKSSTCWQEVPPTRKLPINFASACTPQKAMFTASSTNSTPSTAARPPGWPPNKGC